MHNSFSKIAKKLSATHIIVAELIFATCVIVLANTSSAAPSIFSPYMHAAKLSTFWESWTSYGGTFNDFSAWSIIDKDDPNVTSESFSFITVGNSTIRIPDTGDTHVNKIIREEAERFAKQNLGEEKKEFLTAVSMVGEEYYITIFEHQGSAFATFGVNKNGVFDFRSKVTFVKESEITEYVLNILISRFGGNREDKIAEVKNALQSKSFRFAKNGLVIILNAKDVGDRNPASTYHEVLIPQDILTPLIQ